MESYSLSRLSFEADVISGDLEFRFPLDIGTLDGHVDDVLYAVQERRLIG